MFNVQKDECMQTKVWWDIKEDKILGFVDINKQGIKRENFVDLLEACLQQEIKKS